VQDLYTYDPDPGSYLNLRRQLGLKLNSLP
jgi:hypothetical protein